MKCFNHAEKDAVATCLGCGKSLCRECCQTTDSGRVVCSDPCKQRTTADQETLSLIRQKTQTQNRVSGILCFLAGSIFGLFGLFHLTQPRFFLPLTIFMVAMCVCLIVMGRMYLRMDKEKK